MTISVPSELKARIEVAGEPVNWSALACRAFEAKLAEIIQKRGAKTMEDVVNRLRASKQKTGGEAYARGVEHGEAWAKTDAEADELARLDEFRDSCQRDRYTFADWFEMEGDHTFDHAGWIVAGILGYDHENDDEQDVRNYADQIFGEGPKGRAPDYLRGFVDGSLEVWYEVKNKL
jgi:hypothetical protein